MKLEASPADQPRAGWRQSIRQAREEIGDLVGESPSLRASIPDMVARQLGRARESVDALLADRGETPRVPLDSLTYTPEQITGDWWPA